MSDVGFTHVALLVGDVDASVAFYRKYARMEVVHERRNGGSRVAWVSDRTRPFVIVLIGVPSWVPRALLRGALGLVRLAVPFEHLGVGCASRDEVDRLCAEARADGCLTRGPADYGPPVGYWAFLTDPDGHTIELSYGQEVGLTVEQAKSA
jgi:catechol 2,3-dioxygenase-like lactoylglutathione lyase family enzyme